METYGDYGDVWRRMETYGDGWRRMETNSGYFSSETATCYFLSWYHLGEKIAVVICQSDIASEVPPIDF